MESCGKPVTIYLQETVSTARAQRTHVKLLCSFSQSPLSPHGKQFLLCDRLYKRTKGDSANSIYFIIPREKTTRPWNWNWTPKDAYLMRCEFPHTSLGRKTKINTFSSRCHLPCFPVDAKLSSRSSNGWQSHQQSGPLPAWHRRQKANKSTTLPSSLGWKGAVQAGFKEKNYFPSPLFLAVLNYTHTLFFFCCWINIKREAFLGPSVWPYCKTKPHSTGPAGPWAFQEAQRETRGGGGMETPNISSFVFPFTSRPNNTFP